MNFIFVCFVVVDRKRLEVKIMMMCVVMYEFDREKADHDVQKVSHKNAVANHGLNDGRNDVIRA